MTDLPFYDEDEVVPEPKPRAEVRFTAASVTPYGDGRRVKLALTLTPFFERPDIEAQVTNAAGHEVASLSLIEAMDHDLEFTLHLRGPQPTGEHTVLLSAVYRASDDPDAARDVVDTHTLTFISPTA